MIDRAAKKAAAVATNALLGAVRAYQKARDALEGGFRPGR